MGDQEFELTPQQREALDMLAMPGKRMGPYLHDERTVSTTSRHMEIPATMAIPTSPPSDEEEKNVFVTMAYKALQAGEVIFNPVQEYETYLELFNLGLVAMETPQGCKVTEIQMTEAGARALGKTLVPCEDLTSKYREHL